jgi:hypothetical protein
MRWEDLFADLESQWDAEQRRELDAEVADRTRRERATVGLYERLSAARGEQVDAVLASGVRVSGPVADVGDGWVLLSDPRPSAQPMVVPFGALVSLVGLRPRAAGQGMGRSFGLGYVLRGLSRDRAVVAVTDLTGAVTTGTIDAVWSDAFELAEHAADLPRRPENVTGRRVVPFTALVLVRPA